MGCGLNKLEKHDEKRPGNIYSTLKRPQVETKIDIFYEYHFLEFTTLNDGKLILIFSSKNLSRISVIFYVDKEYR